MRGAGGTRGGLTPFFLGIGMFAVGIYLFLKNVTVSNQFGIGTTIFHVGRAFNVTTGYILIPFIIGIILVFYNYELIIGWVLVALSILLLIFGIISSFKLTWARMSAFDTLLILVLLFGGVGLFMRSLRSN